MDYLVNGVSGCGNFRESQSYGACKSVQFPAAKYGNDESQTSPGFQRLVGEKKRRKRPAGSRTKRRNVLNAEKIVREESENGECWNYDRSDIQKSVMSEILQGNDNKEEIRNRGKM